MKTLFLALMLLVAPVVVAQDVPTYTRAVYSQECTIAGVKAGNARQVVAAICECGAQAVAYVKSGKREADFAVKADDPVVNASVAYCINMANENPTMFMETFGSTQASR